jgi:hypothetical protein
MMHMPRVHPSTRRAHTVIAAIAVVLTVVGLANAQAPSVPKDRTANPSPPKQAPGVNPQAAAGAEFQTRLQNYIKLREELAAKLRPLSSTANAAELATRQEALAAALRDVRKNAKRGDLIPAAVAKQIQSIVADYFRSKDAATRRAVFEEVPVAMRPVVNKTMPDSAALATVPPILLNNLPRLPDNLQYRFMDHHIVLLDGDTRLIMDYLLNVLPPH